MFRCNGCHKVSLPGETLTKQIVLRRSKTYPLRKGVFMDLVEKEPRDDPGGEGWEIVKEISVCPRCAAKPAPEV